MAAWGSGGPGRPAFACPVKAGKIARCPKAPAEQPDWLCQPESKVGPVVNLATSDDPRLFPIIQRNSATYEESYSLRTGCRLLSDEDARGTVRRLLTKAAPALP